MVDGVLVYHMFYVLVCKLCVLYAVFCVIYKLCSCELLECSVLAYVCLRFEYYREWRIEMVRLVLGIGIGIDIGIGPGTGAGAGVSVSVWY